MIILRNKHPLCISRIAHITFIVHIFFGSEVNGDLNVTNFKSETLTFFLYQSTMGINKKRGVSKAPKEKNQKIGLIRFFIRNFSKYSISMSVYQ